MVLIATQVKRRRGTTAENDAFTGAEGEITVDTEKHQLRVHDGTTQGGFVIGSGGSGRNIGDIFFTSRTDTALAGAVECDGATYNTTDFTGNGSIGELLEAGKLPYVSLTDYATQIANNGVCGVFGWDGTGTTTFRVPTLQDVFLEAGQAASAGDYISAGLPNITGTWSGTNGVDNIQSGAILQDEDLRSNWWSGATGVNRSSHYSFDASRSNAIYGNSNTVQPNSVKYRVMIQIANGATDEALETCTGVLADVAGLKDRDYVVEKQDPTAENGYTWYRKYKSGWVEQGGRTSNFTNTAASSGQSKTVVLPIAMSNTHYTVNASMCSDESLGNGSVSGYANRVIKPGIMTTTGFSIEQWASLASTGTSVIACWQVSGISA